MISEKTKERLIIGAIILCCVFWIYVCCQSSMLNGWFKTVVGIVIMISVTGVVVAFVAGLVSLYVDVYKGKSLEWIPVSRRVKMGSLFFIFPGLGFCAMIFGMNQWIFWLCSLIFLFAIYVIEVDAKNREPELKFQQIMEEDRRIYAQ